MKDTVKQEKKDSLKALLEGTSIAPALDTTIVNDALADRIDQEFKSRLAKACMGMSPIEILIAYVDWLSHLSISPGKQLKLVQSLFKKSASLGLYSIKSLSGSAADGPASKLERRVSGEDWQRWPFCVFAQVHQTTKDLWNEATHDVAGVSASHEQLVSFLSSQVFDALSPANFIPTNPEIIRTTFEEKGKNLGRGLRNFITDKTNISLDESGDEKDAFKVGENVAVTDGRVVFQNELIELIQYKPVTEEVGAEPVLFCPAWIMKYYILDLSPHKSIVKYLTEQGKTVFMISWKNPTADDRDVGYEDYLKLGLMAALDAINAICPRRKVNAVGYCIGGTLLCTGAAAMARDGDDRLQSVSMFAAQADFTEAGDITCFISPSQLEFIEKLMWKKGYLSSDNMGGSFGSLHASDLIYGGAVDRYLLAKTEKQIDLMAWNADGTRMPYRMHTEYLQKLYLHNELAQNKFMVGGKPVSLSDIRVPMFVLGTETDHVAPWESVYKLHNLTWTELTFLLTSGGHNAGVISGPSHPRRRYRMHTRNPGDRYTDPDSWLNNNEIHSGSWWPAWDTWLDKQMSKTIKPPRTGAARKGYKVLRAAPGEYVFG
jgi:polyhydroxyalkanoate synthase